MCACDLCAANSALWANPPATRRPASPTADLDVETLLRSRHTLTTPDTYRRRADQPTEPWRDETAVADGSVRASEVAS
jgi:hypothetical protein